jgi:hypothetical protein
MAIHLVYYETQKGEILLPPTSDTPCPPECILREANTINEVHALEKRLQQQEMGRIEQQLERDYERTEQARKRSRSKLIDRINSCATDEYTRDFLKHWLMLRDEKKFEYYKTQFRAREIYLEGLHFDRPQTISEASHGKITED